MFSHKSLIKGIDLLDCAKAETDNDKKHPGQCSLHRGDKHNH